MSSKRANDPPRVPIITTVGALVATLKGLPPEALVWLRDESIKDRNMPQPPVAVLEQSVCKTPGGSVRGAEITVWYKTRPPQPVLVPLEVPRD